MVNQIQEFFREGLRRSAPGWFIGLCRLAFGLMWLQRASWRMPPHLLSDWLVFLIELSIGLALLSGLFTRFFSAAGLLVSVSLLIGPAAHSSEARGAYVMMIMFHLLFIATNAGLNWGLDQVLLEKLANSSLRQSAWGRRLMKLL